MAEKVKDRTGLITAEELAKANIMMALLKAFNDSILNMNGLHRRALKQKYNRLVKCSLQYVKELDKMDKINNAYLNIYEDITNLLYEKADILSDTESESVENEDKPSGSNKKRKKTSGKTAKVVLMTNNIDEINSNPEIINKIKVNMNYSSTAKIDVMVYSIEKEVFTGMSNDVY